jgi:hypothetical protein
MKQAMGLEFTSDKKARSLRAARPSKELGRKPSPRNTAGLEGWIPALSERLAASAN